MEVILKFNCMSIDRWNSYSRPASVFYSVQGKVITANGELWTFWTVGASSVSNRSRRGRRQTTQCECPLMVIYRGLRLLTSHDSVCQTYDAPIFPYLKLLLHTKCNLFYQCHVFKLSCSETKFVV